ncbi:MAG TPA: HipA domain-containing protein [Solirubrobacterales bacterium]
MAERRVEVFVQVDGTELLAGELWSHRRRDRESTTFSYAAGYLGHPAAFELDPSLPLRDGAQQTPAGREIFGAFGDCAPDRWGRKLIGRAERRRARSEGETRRTLGEIDYLLGVRDDMRQGALRFRDPDSGTFLAPEDEGVPPLVRLPRLLASAERVDREEEDDEDLRTLLKGGSSLGGARPKAHVIDRNGRPAIAKFPKPSSDEWDVIRWEAAALRLAAAAGVDTPSSRLVEVSGRGVLIVDRFDRRGGLRVPYASAMTMLEAADGDSGSYLEIAEAIETRSPAATADLAQLWRRIAFSILISNTDDHLRNHGFLRLSTAGWSLSPAFDLNPEPEVGRRHLSTAIDLDETEARIEVLMGVASEFRLDERQARKILGEVGEATSGWRRVAEEEGLDRAAIEAMSPAFEHEEADAVRQLAEV